MAIPKNCSFREFKKLVKPFGISWDSSKGKGSHGGFIGLDKSGNRQVYTLPGSERQEIRKRYIKRFLTRFGLSESELFG